MLLFIAGSSLVLLFWSKKRCKQQAVDVKTSLRLQCNSHIALKGILDEKVPTIFRLQQNFFPGRLFLIRKPKVIDIYSFETVETIFFHAFSRDCCVLNKDTANQWQY